MPQPNTTPSSRPTTTRQHATHDTADPTACVVRTCHARIDPTRSICFCTQHADEYDAGAMECCTCGFHGDNVQDFRSTDTPGERTCPRCGSDACYMAPVQTQPCFVCRTPTPVDQLTPCELTEWTSPARNARRTVQMIDLCPLCEALRQYDEQHERAAQAQEE